MLDTPTIYAVMVFVTLLIGVLLLLSWHNQRDEPALIWWGNAYIIGACGLAMLALRGHIPNWLSIEIGNALVVGVAAGSWAGARVFDGRKQIMPVLLGGPVLWIILCQVPPIDTSVNLRIIAASALLSFYTLLLAFELLREHEHKLASRFPAGMLVLAHVVILLARIPMTLYAPIPSNDLKLLSPWYATLNFEALLYIIALAFLALTMTRERAELRYKIASRRDPLTGVANRRAFFDDAERLIRSAERRKEPVAAILFDLDHFKDINDSFGHQTGDEVIRMFADTARREIRGGDLLGRFGGEEFVILLAGENTAGAHACANRIRIAFAQAAEQVAGHAVSAHASAGVAASSVHPVNLHALLAAADKALYQSKKNGRNRVECAEVAPAPFFVISGAA